MLPEKRAVFPGEIGRFRGEIAVFGPTLMGAEGSRPVAAMDAGGSVSKVFDGAATVSDDFGLRPRGSNRPDTGIRVCESREEFATDIINPSESRSIILHIASFPRACQSPAPNPGRPIAHKAAAGR